LACSILVALDPASRSRNTGPLPQVEAQNLDGAKEECRPEPISDAPVSLPPRQSPASPGLLAGLYKRAVAAVLIGATGFFGLGAGSAQAQEATSVAPPETAEVTPKPTAKSDDEPIRAPARLELDNPLTSSSTNAADYAFVARATGAALDKFHARFPEIDRNFAARFLEWSALFGAEVPWMVLSHEGGHYRVVDKLGWKPSIEFTGWASGMTYYPGRPDLPPGDKRDVMAAAAGVNQEQLNAGLMYEDWARNGRASYPEAMAFLLAETNTALYAARSAVRGANNAPSSDDIAAYIAGLNARGHKITVGHLVAMSAVSDLLSAPAWAAMIGQIRYLANGDRSVEIPRFKVGSLEATFPIFHTLLTSEGPVMGGRLLLDPRGKVPVELSMDVRVDGSAAAIGAKVLDVPLVKSLSLNPFLRLTADGRSGAGARVGTDLRWSISDSVSVIGTAAFQARDLLAEPEGKKSGLDLSISVGFKF
jgi:hypothetical protein